MTDSDLIASCSNQGEVDIGTRLKIIREHNGLSQRELAKRAGVPHSSISMIEQGLNSPSVNSLAKILGGIPMNLAYFFNCDLKLLSQSIYRAAELAIIQQPVGPGIFSQKIPLQGLSASTVFTRVIYLAATDSGETPLRLAQAISGFVVDGCIELSVNAEVSLLESGDAFSLSALQPHRFRNVSDSQNCVVLICKTD